MAWSIVGVGTSVEVTATAHALTVPAGIAQGDLLVACIASRIASTTSITLPTGGEWTLVGEQKANNILSTGSAVASAMMAYCVRGASNPNLTFTHPTAPAPALGRIVAYRGGATPTASAKDTQAAATTAISITAVDLAGLTTTQADDLIVAMLAGGQEAAWSVFKSANAPSTASGATDTTTAPSTTTWIERADVQTTTGNDTSLGIFDAVKTAAGATGNFTATASVAASHALVAGAFKIAPPPTADAWSNVDKSANITLSNSDKTATSTSATQAGVHSTTTRMNGTAGKYYAEFLLGATPFGGVGIQLTSNPEEDAGFSFYVLGTNGHIFVNDTDVGTVGSAYSSGDVICVAWDAGAERVWFRKNAGNWNNDASASPATGTNGLDASFAAASTHALWGASTASGGSVTLRTELAEFTQAVPSGFTSWMGENAYRLTAVAGSYALTGADATLTKAGPPVDRQYAVGGAIGAAYVSETGTRQYSIFPAYLAETMVLPAVGTVLPAAAGSYALTGTAATLIKITNRSLAAVSGTYALSGAATTFRHVWRTTVVAGAYGLTGTAATFARAYRTTAISGTYTLTGTPANLLKPGAYAIIGLPGAYALTGAITSLELGREVLAVGSTYALSGTDTSLEKGREITADAGAYALTGTAASLERGCTVAAVAGSYALTGNVTSLELGKEVLATAGAYALTGASTTLLRTRRVTAVAGSYALSGLPINLLKTGAWAIIGLPGSYALTGQPATLSKAVLAAYAIVAAPGSYTLTGSPASLIWSGEVITPPGSGQRDGDAVERRKKRRGKIYTILIEVAKKVVERPLPLRKKRKKLAKLIVEEVLPEAGGLLAADKLLLELMIRRQLEQIPLNEMHTEGWYQLQDQLLEVITDAEQTAQLLRAEAEEEDDLLLLLTS